MTDDKTIESGDAVYDGDGTEIGTVTGVTTDGLRVAADEEVEYVGDASETGATGGDGTEQIDPEEHDPGPEFGEGYIMWRCESCGEVGELDDGLPTECPNCGAEEVHKRRED